MKKFFYFIPFILLVSCVQQDLNSDQRLKELITYTYPYVATFNTLFNFSKPSENGSISTGGWNKQYIPQKLADHNTTAIPRPNNDSLYLLSLLDLRAEPVIITYPVYDSDNVIMDVVALDHSIEIPLSTSQGDFKKETTVLYYSDLTKNYKDFDKTEYDKVIKLNGDLGISFLRIMPHYTDKERYKRNLKLIKKTRLMTYSQHEIIPPVEVKPLVAPAFGTDEMVYENNLLEVMQFIIDHLAFKKNIIIDKKMLSVIAAYGVKPSSQYEKDEKKEYVTLDTEKILALMKEMKQEQYQLYQQFTPKDILKIFLPNEKTRIKYLLLETVIGPLGVPAKEAIYPEILTEDGQPLNALYDYKISMTKDELPPARSFWSFTLYDLDKGFFIPNKYKKYSVGQNGGMKLNKEGGINIYIAEKKPEGVPMENWLPINRKDQYLDVKLRMYLPDLKKYKTWKKPIIKKI